MAIGVAPDTLDPAAQTATPVAQIVDMTVERLVTLDAQNAVRPLLATRWRESSDRRTWTFWLRSGVRFQDGEPLTATAVRDSFHRLLDPATPGAQPGGLRVVSRVTAAGSEVRFTLRRPFTPFLRALTSPHAGILAPRSLALAANDGGRLLTPIGTGPYRLTGRGADYVSLRRSDSYWGATPPYARQIFRVVPQDAEREALLRDGQVDVALDPPPADLQDLSTTGGDQLLAVPSDRMLAIAIDTQDSRQPQLQDPTVRQALSHAVDTAGIVRTLLAGSAVAAVSPLAPTTFGFCSTGAYTYDPALAQSMLEQAGAGGMRLTLATPVGRDAADLSVAQAVAGALDAVGLQVTVAAEPSWPDYLRRLATSGPSTPDLALLGWAPSSVDGVEALAPFQTAGRPPHGLGFSRFDDPAADELITQASSANDAAVREQALCQASREVWQGAPAIFLYSPDQTVVASRAVSGLTVLPADGLVTTWAAPS
ncbi:MAG: ABC transporter substrate-binding protein [Candidatus Dormiibacterota bacterium]